VLDELSRIAPVHAVSGNVDDRRDPMLRLERVVKAGEITIHVSHGDELGRPTAALALARYTGDVVVFGHTHRAVIVRDGAGRIAINPGAAGPRRFDVQPSVATLTIVGREVEAEIISLA
jgi:putative phosphoesterase